MKIYIAGDHAGFKLKEKIKKYFDKKNISYKDFGPHRYNSKDDYPDFVIPMAKAVAKSRGSLGIVVAGSGIGETIAANKVKSIKAVLYHGKSPDLITTSKLHDNANILCMGSRFVKKRDAIKSIELWLKTPFSNAARHKRRLRKIDLFEKKKQ